MRRPMLWFAAAAWLLLGLSLAVAQDENRLINGSLDEGGSFGPYTTRRGGEFPIYLPNGWNYWLAPQTGEFFNRGDRTTINPHPGPGPSPTNGNRALSVDCGFVTCTAAVYQQVTVEEGQNIQASAWAQVKACNIAPDADNCGSARESGARTRIGIDPNGGTSPNDSDIVWSNWVEPHDQWLEMRVSATTTGTTATLFLYSTQASTAQINRTYWDDTRLTGGGSGGVAGPDGSAAPAATPVPTAPPSVAFVVPQNERDDGSIVHVVREGDTIDSIAVAYRVTRADIMALNNIVDPRIINVGQQLIIRAPTSSTTAPDAPAAEGPTEPDTATDEGSSEPGIPADEGSSEPDAPADEGSSEPDAPTDEAPSEPTATPMPAPVVSVADGRVLPANDPTGLMGAVCVEMFDDLNQNRIREAGEAPLPGGQINLLAAGETRGSLETTGDDAPLCFEEIEPGEYVLAAAPPSGFGLTSPNQFRVRVVPGSPLLLNFGAAQGVAEIVLPPDDATGPVSEVRGDEPEAQSPLDGLIANAGLIVFGLAGVVLVSGLGLTLLLRQR